MDSDEPMERFYGEMTLAEFLENRASKLEAEYRRTVDVRYDRWYVRHLERQIITGSY